MNSKKIPLFGLSFFQFAAFAFIAPFFILYYQSLNFNGTEIGLLTGLAPLVMLFAAPLWTGFADVTHRQRLMMGLSLLGSVILVFSFSLVNTFAIVLVVIILYSFFNAPVASFADGAVMSMLANEKEMYGRIRVGGTIGFALAAPIAGPVLENYGLGTVFSIGAILMLVTLLISQRLNFSSHVKSEASTSHSIRLLLSNRRWIPFLILAFSSGMGIAASNTFLLAYMTSLGTPNDMLGWVLSFGTFSEIPILFFGNYLLKWFKPTGLLFLSILLTGIRLLLFGIAPTYQFAMVLQIFNGITFPATWMAGVAYADENAPPGLSTTAQGLFGAIVFGCGAAVGGFAGGPLIESLGGHNFYLIFGGVILLLMLLAGVIQRFMPLKPQLELEKEP